MAAISTGDVFSSTDAFREVWTIATEVAQGTALLDTAERPAVAYTPSGGHTRSVVDGPYTTTGIPDGGVGLAALKVSVALDGTWEFPVTGASSATLGGVIVYAVMSGADIASLTLTVGSNKKFGVVNYPVGYVVSGTTVPVKVGK